MNLQKTAIAISTALILGGCSFSGDEVTSNEPLGANTITMSWESAGDGLDTPESVLHDQDAGVIYVANINSSESGKNWADNGGYLSTLDENGSLKQKKWVEGLQAPKGMAVHNGKLYVADLDTVVVVDTSTGKVLAKHSAPEGTKYLNDIIYNPETDTAYVSDSSQSAVYAVDSSGEFTLFYQSEGDDAFQNGLYLDDKNIIMAGTRGAIKSLSLSDGSVTTIATGIEGSIDGIWRYDSSGFLVSVWQGGIYFVGNNGEVTEITKSAPERTADVSYSSKLKLLLVPDFKDKVIAYKVSNEAK